MKLMDFYNLQHPVYFERNVPCRRRLKVDIKLPEHEASGKNQVQFCEIALKPSREL